MLIRNLFSVFAVFVFTYVGAQNNLIEPDRWVVGSLTTQLAPEFEAAGGAGRNFIEAHDNPFGESSAVWRSKLGPNEAHLYPGFRTEQYSSDEIDINKDYRYSVWVKTTGNESLSTSLVADYTGYEFEIGANGPINSRLVINSSKNIPGLNQWYLLVSFVRAANSSESDDDYATASGYYEVGGNQIVTGLGQTIGRFHPTKTNVIFKIGQQFYSPTNTPEMFYYNPRLEPIDGQQPNISDLTDPNWVEPIGSSGTGLWSSNTNGIHFLGNVGIGNDAPDAPLAVSGRIHAQEVKVTATVPAPDYVFYEDYDLNTLEEIQNYINEYGHLPNIPSAKEIEANGIELGLMNMKLLEKIEELTLYILEQDKKIKDIQEKLKISN